MKDERQPFQNSRLQKREKRRKTNIILNSLIVIVLLLIVIVSIKIFFTDDQQAGTTATENQTKNSSIDTKAGTSERTGQSSKDSNQQDDESEAIDDTEADKNLEDKNDNSDAVADKEDKEQDSEIVTEGGNDPDVKKTIVNPGWKPVGTEQTGKHSNNYSGVDWDEMVQAISYATGIDEGNMTIYYLGNNGEDKSVGTVQAKDTKQKYRVYIEWVDGKGWNPTLVEELTK
nr:YrrS family protein [uncultured Bacillus sp.]